MGTISYSNYGTKGGYNYISHKYIYIYVCIYIYSTTDTNYIPHIKREIYIIIYIYIYPSYAYRNSNDLPTLWIPERPSTATRTCRCDSSTSSCKQSAATSLLAVSSSDPVRAVARPVVILPCGDFWGELGKKIEKHMGKHGENTEKT